MLRGADLTLHRGEIVALVAPSGAGKSTLLHLAGLLEKPDGGTVRRWTGATPARWADAERTAIRRDLIGFVYQFHHLLPEFTALENVVPAADDRREAARGGDRPGGVAARRVRPRQARAAHARQALGRRAATGRHRPCARQRAARAARRRADRQPRCRHRRSRIRGAAECRAAPGRRGTNRDAQPGPGGAHGPDGDLARRDWSWAVKTSSRSSNRCTPAHAASRPAPCRRSCHRCRSGRPKRRSSRPDPPSRRPASRSN